MTSFPLASRTLESFRIRSGLGSDGQRNIGMTMPAARFTLFTAELPFWVWSSVHPASPLNVSRFQMFPCSMYGMVKTAQLVPSPLHGQGPPDSGRPSDDPALGRYFLTSWKLWMARPSCLRLF